MFTQLDAPACFDEITEIHALDSDMRQRYLRMRKMLERISRQLATDAGVPFNDLFSRLNYVCRNSQLDRSTTFRLNSVRIHANRVVHDDYIPDDQTYVNDIRTLCEAVAHFYKSTIPDNVKQWLPAAETAPKSAAKTRLQRLRVQVTAIEEHQLLAISPEVEGEIFISIHVPGRNDVFRQTIQVLWPGCQLNLVDVIIEEGTKYVPHMIVLEPDYLMDITAVAENFKEYGCHPLNHLMGKLKGYSPNIHQMVGNFANLVFDHFIHENPESENGWKSLMETLFRQYPLEFTSFTELDNEVDKNKFKENTKLQYENIQRIFRQTFSDPGYAVRTEDAILEPAFLCETLGIQGRMDYLQKDYKTLIELKSGSASQSNASFGIRENHMVQLLLYLGVIHYSLGTDYRNVNAFLLYSKHALLLRADIVWNHLKKAINIRNLMIANEYQMGLSVEHAEKITSTLLPEVLNMYQRQDKYWQKYLLPPIEEVARVLKGASEAERKFFHAFLSFTAREHYLSKLHVSRTDDERDGSFWLDIAGKTASGEVLNNLTLLTEIQAGAEESILEFNMNSEEQNMHAGFREGDIVFIYQYNTATDSATTQQIYKGSVTQIGAGKIAVRLNYRLRSGHLLPATSRYVIEHDFSDKTYQNMYQGLMSFLKADISRKNLLLGQEGCKPETDDTVQLLFDHGSEDICEAVLKAKRAKELFLLVGPPGTGKTSRALKAMVEEFYHSSPDESILLLAYTNRAVDEMCEALENASGSPSYIRIGSRPGCHPNFRKQLIDQVVMHCQTREQVKKIILDCRIFVGTIASVGGKEALFNIKKFGTVIVDEASQIVEPSLLGILSSRCRDGRHSVGRWILIGDHKQLPAVVIQPEKESSIQDDLLKSVGLYDRRQSTFERLFRLYRCTDSAWHMLNRQGRMHPEIADFPNTRFYGGRLTEVPVSHQTGTLPFKISEGVSELSAILSTKRVIFMPSKTKPTEFEGKTNEFEARLVVKMLKVLDKLCSGGGLQLAGTGLEGHQVLTVGIITPYRRQIALIRNLLMSSENKAWHNITIDTVERYQGSQRDIIILSLCLNSVHQLKTMSSIMEEEGKIIDRKLNVALTRARQQIIITGNPFFMEQDAIYNDFLQYIKEKQGYVG
jgi:hypothetical protein